MTSLRPPQHLETARTLLRPVTRDDAAAIFNGYASSHAATRYMVWPRAKAPDPASVAERSEQGWASGNAFPWAVILHATGEFLGVIELRINPPKADLGYIFCEPFWGRGFASEVVKCVVDWAFGQPEIFRVWATCHPGNAASIRVLNKAGLRFEARLENWEARPQLGLQAGPSMVYAKVKPVGGPEVDTVAPT
jgi:RimJ/RimL family protein N-acetyltransferase